MKPINEAQLKEVISSFRFNGTLIGCEKSTIGHINGTYFLSFKESDGKVVRYILQRINTDVFPNPAALMKNLEEVTSFLSKKILARGGNPRMECLTLVKAKNDQYYYVDKDNFYYRGYLFIEPSVCYSSIDNGEVFKQAAMAFGRFQNDLSDFPSSTLYEIIPNFHNTHERMKKFKDVISKDIKSRAASCQKTIDGYLENEEYADIFFDLPKDKFPLRVTHNDTKLNNVLFDGEGKKAIAVIDLDTVMPGYAMNDFGDAIRYGANFGKEDEKDLSKVGLNLEYFKLFAEGFISQCGKSLTKEELQYLPYGAMVMTYECGMRFLTDYLEGDVYFRIDYPEHNLVRAKDQLALFLDMKKKKTEMDEIISSLMNK
ncbi:MAG TPA: mucin desulfatase [Firmicutes bacterium]|nr:mucin desulfatase [Bacillota bacterium]HBM70838.1 mucin desulfatase [Bacillota bacterium]